MSVAGTIQFTTSQARDIAGVSPEVWRHWRMNIPFLGAKKGKAARFSAGEIVVLCAVRNAIDDYGVKVTILSNSFNQIFKASKSMSPNDLKDCSFVISSRSGEVVKSSCINLSNQAVIVMPCDMIVEQVWNATFHSSKSENKINNPFTPKLVSGVSSS